MRTVFLGGTIGNDYRERLSTLLVSGGIPVEYIFNPVVPQWDQAAQEREDAMKANPLVIMIYYLGADHAQGGNFLSFYSLHEATMGLYDDPDRTIVVFDYVGMVDRAAKRLRKVHRDLSKRFPDARLYTSVEEAGAFIIENQSQ